MYQYKGKNNRNNKKIIYTVLGALFVVCLCLGSFYLGNLFATKGLVLATTNSKVDKEFKDFNNIDEYKELFEVRDALIKNYDGEINDNIAVEGAIKGRHARRPPARPAPARPRAHRPADARASPRRRAPGPAGRDAARSRRGGPSPVPRRRRRRRTCRSAPRPRCSAARGPRGRR